MVTTGGSKFLFQFYLRLVLWVRRGLGLRSPLSFLLWLKVCLEFGSSSGSRWELSPGLGAGYGVGSGYGFWFCFLRWRVRLKFNKTHMFINKCWLSKKHSILFIKHNTKWSSLIPSKLYHEFWRFWKFIFVRLLTSRVVRGRTGSGKTEN